VIAGLTMWAALAAADGIVHQDLLRVNSVLLGGAEAVVGALVVTEALKLSIGRLRPYFRDRYARAACGGVVAVPDGLDCSTVAADGFVMTRAQLIDGLKSFPSGHASSSFAGATFASLWLGTELVWGPDAPTWGPAVGSLGIAGLLGGAGFIAASRVSDHKHHVEDVVVGSAIGLGAGAAAWLLHFDLDGNRRRTDLTVAPVLLENGGGFALSGPLP
jgi:diacylglycerol diphosphate phosphatase/phosphatidate phosphatase